MGKLSTTEASPEKNKEMFMQYYFKTASIGDAREKRPQRERFFMKGVTKKYESPAICPTIILNAFSRTGNHKKRLLRFEESKVV